MPKSKSDKPPRTGAKSSEAATHKPIQPTRSLQKRKGNLPQGRTADVEPKLKLDSDRHPPQANVAIAEPRLLTLDEDGLEIIEDVCAGKETISLLSQLETSGPNTFSLGVQAAAVGHRVMDHEADLALVPVRSSQELKKTSSGMSQSSQRYWEGYGDLDDDELAVVKKLDLLASNLPERDSSASTPSLVSTSSSMDSSPSVLGKRKAEDNHGPPKIKAVKASGHMLVLDSETPLGSSSGSSIAVSCPKVKLTEGVVIASDKSFELALTLKGIPYMSRYEMARLHSIDKIRFIDMPLDALDAISNTSNAYAAPITQDIVTQKVVAPEPEPTQFGAAVEDEKAAKSPWREFDEEIEKRSKDPDAGLGCRDNSSYYGGKIHFLAKLKFERPGKNEKFRIVLEKPILGPSCRFARKFGSHSFLRVSVKAAKKELKNSDSKLLLDFFRRPFFLMDHVYRACFAKDNTVILFLTNEIIINGEALPPSAEYKPRYFDGKMSLLDFLNWHNPLKFNSEQAAAKWAARFALGFSNSVPALRMEAHQIEDIDDVPSSAWNKEGKLPAEHDMTDGNGLGNCVLLQAIRSRLELEEFPSVVQCRLGGAKGTLALHPSGRFDDSQAEPKAYKRPSQDKIKYDPDQPLDQAMLIVDLLKTSHMATPARLSCETITNLAENGVPTSVFVNLMKAAMQELSDALTAWDGDDAMYTLFANVAKIGGVIASRVARELGGESRARGYGDRSEDDSSDDEEADFSDADAELLESSLAWFADLISGQPSSLEETVMSLLSSGFEPQACAILAEKLEKMHTVQLALIMAKYKITVPMSCSAMIIPDPCDPPVLKEGQVHIKIDRTGGKLNGSASDDLIRGEVLVTRHPCKLPSDVQKVVAIEHPDLRHITNAIVFPRVGKRSPAFLLGGGDYDGDTVIAIWQPEIVRNFKPPSNSFVEPPPGFMEENFSKKSQTIKELVEEIGPGDPEKLTLGLQNYLIGSLKEDSLVGAYSNMHEVSIYETGYFSKETIRLAHMFMVIMDAQKSGLVLNQDVLDRDRKRWGSRSLPWKSKARTDDNIVDKSNAPSVKRTPSHTFILEELKHKGQAVEGQLRKKFKTQRLERVLLDPDLVAPFRDAERRAHCIRERTGDPWAIEEMKSLKNHASVSRSYHRQRRLDCHLKSPSRNGNAFTELHITDRQNILRDCSRRHALFPPAEDGELLFLSRAELRRVRASYSYLHDWEESDNRPTRFPWDVDSRELCTIKASALKFEKTVCRKFYDRMNILPRYRTYRT